MGLSVRSVIYFYIMICISLLVFNLFYIVWSRQTKRRRLRRESRWKRGIRFLARKNSENQKVLIERLKSTEELMAFQEVMGQVAETSPEKVREFFHRNRSVFRMLAEVYGKKSAMERAFFAYVVASFHPPAEEKDILPEILLSYLEDSTIYCRENVLRALYALGNGRAVERAFDQLNEHGWYHDPRLLSDGLACFTGDKEELAKQLWHNRDRWEEFLSVAVVRFAEGLSGDGLSGMFFEALDGGSCPLEVEFTLVRYFQRHPIFKAKQKLIQLLREEGREDHQLAIAAASVLSAYPGEDTRQALKAGLHSRNWYVRQNAARSLKHFGITREEIEQFQEDKDSYAWEALEYALGYEEKNLAAAEAAAAREGEEAAVPV